MLFAGGVAAVFAAFTGPASGGTASDTFQVTASVVAACVLSTNTLAFGNYDPTSATPKDASASLLITCTNGAAYTVALNEGAGAGATVAARKMTSGSDTLTYSLYQDALRSTLWGVAGAAVAGTGTGAQQTLTIYGRAPIAQSAPAGSYSDTITVTVDF